MLSTCPVEGLCRVGDWVRWAGRQTPGTVGNKCCLEATQSVVFCWTKAVFCASFWLWTEFEFIVCHLLSWFFQPKQSPASMYRWGRLEFQGRNTDSFTSTWVIIWGYCHFRTSLPMLWWVLVSQRLQKDAFRCWGQTLQVCPLSSHAFQMQRWSWPLRHHAASARRAGCCPSRSTALPSVLSSQFPDWIRSSEH